jgi:hypothetical protein
MHGLKVLTIVFPNGIIAYLYGPVSAWENDISLPNLSWLNEYCGSGKWGRYSLLLLVWR